VLILPSYREGFPNAVLQAGAMGLPSIVSDISGCNEIIEHEINGLLVPKKNHIELQKAMEKMLYNPSLLKGFYQNARNKVVKSFDKNFVWKELKKEYENALDKLKLQKK
jgi:glycosyltransferase involved in cell wall biosynthesis